MKNITPRHRRFVQAYTGEHMGNGAAAAREAGYSESRARNTAYRLLQDEDIQRMISERMEELAMSDAEALKRLSDIARADISDFLEKKTFVDEHGNEREEVVVNAEAVMEHGGGIIQGFDRNGKPKLYDAKDALKTILDLHGAFNHDQKHEHEHNGFNITIVPPDGDD